MRVAGLWSTLRAWALKIRIFTSQDGLVRGYVGHLTPSRYILSTTHPPVCSGRMVIEAHTQSGTSISDVFAFGPCEPKAMLNVRTNGAPPTKRSSVLLRINKLGRWQRMSYELCWYRIRLLRLIPKIASLILILPRWRLIKGWHNVGNCGNPLLGITRLIDWLWEQHFPFRNLVVELIRSEICGLRQLIAFCYEPPHSSLLIQSFLSSRSIQILYDRFMLCMNDAVSIACKKSYTCGVICSNPWC